MEKLKHFLKILFSSRVIFNILIATVFLVGFWVRFWQLDSLPPGIHYDEAYNGINALESLESGNFKLFYAENTGREGLHINAIAFFLKLFGVNNFALRFANALWGSLTLVGFYFLLRELRFSKSSILAGTFMLAFSFWHLDFSRTAYRAILVPLIIIWSAYFFFRGLRSERRKYLFFILSGIFLGIGFHSYIAFRVAPLIFVVLGLAYFIFQKGFWKKYWKAVVIFCVASIIIASPIIYYFSSHYGELVGRSQSVSIFNAPNLTPAQAFLKSLGYHLRAFFVHGDGNARHNYNSQALVPMSWTIFLVLGFLISLREIFATIINRIRVGGKNKVTDFFYVSVFSQSIFWIMLVPGVMSIEGIPHSLRIIGVIPGVFLFSVLPIEYLTRFYKKTRSFSDASGSRKKSRIVKLLLFGSAIAIFIGGLFQMRTYFYVWSRDLRTEVGFERKLYLFGKAIKDLPQHKYNYAVLTNSAQISNSQKQSSFKTTEFIAYPSIKKYEFYKPLDGIDKVNCEDTLIIFFESDQWLRDQYRNHCLGNFTTEEKRYDNNKYIFYILETRK